MKQIVKKTKINIVNIPKIEKWLEEQAQNGLSLVDYKNRTFIFEETKTKQSIYYVYISPLGDKKDFYLREFNSLKRLYGKRKSKLNKKKSKLIKIVEIDLSKIDDDYKWFAISRNAYYLKYNSKFLIIYLCASVILFVFSFFEKSIIYLLVIFLFLLLHRFTFTLFLRKQKKTLLKNLM